MSVLDGLRRAGRRSSPLPISFDEWVSYFSFDGLAYPHKSGSLAQPGEEIDAGFAGYAEQVYKANGPIFACMATRALVFTEARFQFRRQRGGRLGDLFGTPALAPLESPFGPSSTTGDLLKRAIQDVDLGGNFYARITNVGQGRSRARGFKRLRPDWVTIVLGSQREPDDPAGAIDAEILGYVYTPGGPYSGRDPLALLAEEVVHWAPIPDPTAEFRGMSWLTPVIREVLGDAAATRHKLKFFENGATPNLVVTLDSKLQRDAFEKWIDLFESQHEGVANAYKTLFLAAGAKAEAIGADLKEADFKITQGAGETRIAAAAGVPPVIAGFSEGLQAATYSNYGQARRRFADGTLRPLWRDFAGAVAPAIAVPSDAVLWYDDRDIAFLRDDAKDEAEIAQVEASSIKTLVDAGYEPDSIVDAITNGDWTRLVHSGLYSVQLQPPNPDQPTDPAADAGRSLATLLKPFLPATNGHKEA